MKWNFYRPVGPNLQLESSPKGRTGLVGHLGAPVQGTRHERRLSRPPLHVGRVQKFQTILRLVGPNLEYIRR